MKRLGASLAALLLVLGFAPARAAVLCKARTGALLVRDACKRSEASVDLVQFGPAGAPGTRGAAGFGAVLNDTNNAFVGSLLDDPLLVPTVATRVLRTVEDDVVSFTVDAATGFLDTSFPFVVYYEHPGCTGRLFLAPLISTNQPMFPQALIHDGIAFYPVDALELHPTVSLLTFTTMGLCSGTFTAPDQCCVPAPGTPLAAEGKALALGSFGLVPPFHTDAP